MSFEDSLKTDEEITKEIEKEESLYRYVGYKLGRRADAFHDGYPAVGNGRLFYGWEVKAGIVPVLKDENGDSHIGRAEFTEDGKLIPKIDHCVGIYISHWNSGFNFLRTSKIQDFYIHGDYENSKDKMVITNPENAMLLDGVKFEDGDIVLFTMNSIYLLREKDKVKDDIRGE